MRREELTAMVEEVKAASAESEVVNLSEKVGEVKENMTCRMIFGRCKYDKMNLKSIITNMFHLTGAFNLADYVPCLTPFDLQGLARRMKKASKDLDGILEPIIQEHEQNPNNESSIHDDFIDMMLLMKKKSMEDNDDNLLTINRSNMKAIVLDMIAAAIDTSNVTIQWTLSELIKSPRTMEKLQQELDNVVGRNRLVEERDLTNLTYLNMVVKEGLRLHAPGPLLVPHESLEDIVINGYFIPKRSRVIINFWAIGRDPDAWSDNAEEFFPERFIGSNIDVKGRDFQLIPFGSGRRGCPGLKLGLLKIQLVVAQLVHCFDWELPDGMAPADLDMTEVFGLAVPRAKPLLAVPTYRL
jgi:cytochrome P450